jgi:hypothetical protein
MIGDGADVLIALRHLMMMVHCDFTGELRQPHYYPWPGLLRGAPPKKTEEQP